MGVESNEKINFNGMCWRKQQGDSTRRKGFVILNLVVGNGRPMIRGARGFTIL